MTLQVFNFIDNAIESLDKSKEDLETATKILEHYFDEILSVRSEGYLNINSRVKSAISLKEKIIRNSYYKKYGSPEELFTNLSDLIGIRVECRFIKDENDIYKAIKSYFNNICSDGLYCNHSNKNVKLDLRGKQPQEQKNGFAIYRIDGVYEYKDNSFNFELQIKSLVNVFWSEIEHKVIYKNYNYMIADKFFKDMMFSIKRNLTMIDNQLLIIYNQFKNMNSIDSSYRKYQIESLLSKIIYDIFSTKVQNSLGFIVDFRKSCDVIMQYIFSTSNVKDINDYNNVLLNTLNRFNDISKNELDFESEITFERDIHFEDNFSSIVGGHILESINKDFEWNIFFKILFEIELGNNAEDFEDFIGFFKNQVSVNKSFMKLYMSFKDEEAESIINSFMEQIAYSFKNIDSIEFLYEDNIKKINEVIDSFINLLLRDIYSFSGWEIMKDSYLELFNMKILSIFNIEIPSNEAAEIIKNIMEGNTEFKGKLKCIGIDKSTHLA
jgi:ppGpp synthetase/RelA/SpoT-type nucleotidyltranferase